MPAAPRPKTYEELRLERQREWASAQKLMATELATLHAGLAEKPDVKDGPLVGAQWESRGVACPGCGDTKFYVHRYVTVNGVKHRIELECVACSRKETWDFGLQAWLP